LPWLSRITASSGRVRPRSSCARRSKWRCSRSRRPRGRSGRHRLQDFDHADLRRQRRRAAPLGQRQAERLEAVILQHDMRDIVGHLARTALRSSNGNRPSIISRLSAILMLTSLSEQSTPAELSMKSVLMRPPFLGEFDPARLRDAQIGALADHFGAHLVAIDAMRVVGGIADLGIGLGRRLHIGADAAEPEQVDRRFQDRGDQPRRIEFVSASMPSTAAICGDSGIVFCVRGKMPPPSEISPAS
jgi:hypothetical protein